MDPNYLGYPLIVEVVQEDYQVPCHSLELTVDNDSTRYNLVAVSVANGGVAVSVVG